MGQLNFRFFYHQLLYLDLIIGVVLKYLTGPTVELTEEEKDDNNKESKVEEDEEETDHYQSVRSGENLYSYAYRDSFSPAAMIKLEDCSDVSEDFYDSIKAPSETSRGDTVESVSEAGDMFLSIR